jgi:patatin-related protein
MTDFGEFDRQDIRLAVVMNGGVSLAVWIGGVAVELHHLAMASTWQKPDPVYRPLLDLLHADARVDIIAGTSAGGLNGAFLALGLAQNRSITSIRDLWRDKGSLTELLQHPLRKQPPSLLKGDYFLEEIRGALSHVMTSTPRPVAGGGAADERPVELFLTGTLWDGRETTFSDDMGVRMTEVDHDARFLFKTGTGKTASSDGDLCNVAVVHQLAVAARCSSSFPAAFEPQWVTVTEPESDRVKDGPWSSDAGRANFRTSQYVIDGGILLNKPIRPALEAVYRQTAQFQVRRLLTYVVPDPGERPPPGSKPASPDDTPGEVPNAPQVLLDVLTRLRSTDSVSRELAEIRRRNEDVQQRRRTRDRFAIAMATTAGALSEAAWAGYVDVRMRHAAQTIGRWMITGQQSTRNDRWSEREVVSCLTQLLRDRREQPGPAGSFIPVGDSAANAAKRTGEDWDWGQSTVRRLRDMTVDVLKRAVWLAPTGSEQRRDIVDQRQQASAVFKEIQADWGELGDHWCSVGADLPARKEDKLGQAKGASVEQLQHKLREDLDTWGTPSNPGAREIAAKRYDWALRLAGCLVACTDALREVAAMGNTVVDPDGSETKRLKALTDFLLEPATPASKRRGHPPRTHTTATVLSRMLLLEVVQLAYAETHHGVEQEVELVQFSSQNPELLTGRQLHHFGAFHRESWRINDWIHGRMDAAAHLAQCLMSTERLRQLYSEENPAEVVSRIRACAVDAAEDKEDDYLAALWDTKYATPCLHFVTKRITVDRPPSATDNPQDDPNLAQCIDAITHALQTNILRQDLDELAKTVRSEGPGRPASSTQWLDEYDAQIKAAAGKPLAPEKMWEQWRSAEDIGKQLLTEEVGGDHLANTVARTAAVTVNSVGAVSRVKAVGVVLSAFRGYTLAVWAMVHFLTRTGKFGNRAVQLALATGGVMLAVSLFVPGMPVAFTLAGVLVLLAGWSAAALLDPGARRVGVRLAWATFAVVLAFAGYIWGDDGRDLDWAALWRLAVKLGIGLLIVLLGWWISRAKEEPFSPRLVLGRWVSRVKKWCSKSAENKRRPSMRAVLETRQKAAAAQVKDLGAELERMRTALAVAEKVHRRRVIGLEQWRCLAERLAEEEDALGPQRRQASEVEESSPDYQALMAAAVDAGADGLDTRRAAAVLGWNGASASRVEGVKARLQRLVEWGWLVERKPGRFTLPASEQDPGAGRPGGGS